MKLFHYSESKHAELTPQYGSRRHQAESNGVAIDSGVWLTDDSDNAPLIGGWLPKYRHMVEVEPNDPLLVEEQKFSGPGIPRTYLYKGLLAVQEVSDYIATNHVIIRDGEIIDANKA